MKNEFKISRMIKLDENKKQKMFIDILRNQGELACMISSLCDILTTESAVTVNLSKTEINKSRIKILSSVGKNLLNYDNKED